MDNPKRKTKWELIEREIAEPQTQEQGQGIPLMSLTSGTPYNPLDSKITRLEARVEALEKVVRELSEQVYRREVIAISEVLYDHP